MREVATWSKLKKEFDDGNLIIKMLTHTKLNHIY